MVNYELIPSAEREIAQILDYTVKNYGPKQMLIYRDQLKSCFAIIAAEKGSYRTRKRHNKTIRYLHCQKHYIFALERVAKQILIIAVFHERMDLVSRLEKKLKLL